MRWLFLKVSTRQSFPRSSSVATQVTPFVTFNILSNGNVKFCMYQQILLFRSTTWMLCQYTRWFTTAEKERQHSPERQWSLYTFIDNSLSFLPWTLIFRFDSHFLFAFLSLARFSFFCRKSAIILTLFTNHFCLRQFSHQKSFLLQQNIMQISASPLES